VKKFDADKTRVTGLPYGEKNYDNYVKPFSSNTGTSRTDRRTDGLTDRIVISISRVSMLTRDKNYENAKIKMMINYRREIYAPASSVDQDLIHSSQQFDASN